MKKFILLCLLKYVLGDLYPDNNVCPTILDYDTIYVNDRCWYDPDVTASVPEIISNHGLSSTSYNVTTWDGYTIEIFRINPLVNTTTKGSILFFPALTRDCRCFLLQGANSLAIYYAYKGWDVWLGNPRGSEYSSNIHFTKDDDRFWDYSFHEMGTIDMPSQVDKIAEITQNGGNIYLVGYSMGTTVSLLYCATNVSHCQNNVKGIIALAPAANLNRVEQPVLYLISLVELLPGIQKIPFDFLLEICQHAPGIGLCDVLFQALLGPSNPNILPQLLPILTYTGNCPVTNKVVNHYAQIINSQGKFRWYDYGYLENFSRYGTFSPPYYETSKIPVQTTLISANKDIITTEPDIEVLYSSLSATKRTWYKLPENSAPAILMNHVDFITGAEVQREQLYSKINAALGDV